MKYFNKTNSKISSNRSHLHSILVVVFLVTLAAHGGQSQKQGRGRPQNWPINQWPWSRQVNQLALEDEASSAGGRENDEDEEDVRHFLVERPPPQQQRWRPAAGGVKRDTSRGRHAVPLSILDNIDTLRRGLMRELALRRLEQDRREMVQSSEDYKNRKGRK